MFRGFHLKLPETEMKELLKYAGYKIYSSSSQNGSKESPPVVNDLNRYLFDQKKIDANKLELESFPAKPVDIFLSHSHKDIEWVSLLKQFLEDFFSLKVFIDSDVWFYSLDLVKNIEKEFGEKAQHDIICSHVNIMLAAALSRMLDQTDYVFFLNTPNTISLDSSHEERTSSEWIYHELLMTSLLRRKRRKYITATVQEGVEPIFQHKPPLKHLTPLTSEDLKKWIDELGSGNKKLDDMWPRARANRGFPPERRPGNPKEALDLLDQLFPESINDEG